MVGTLRSKTRIGKSAGSKNIAFQQSQFEISAGGKDDLVASVLTAKNLDFFKAEPVTKFKPVIFWQLAIAKNATMCKAFLFPGEEDTTIWARYSCYYGSGCITTSMQQSWIIFQS